MSQVLKDVISFRKLNSVPGLFLFLSELTYNILFMDKRCLLYLRKSLNEIIVK